MLSSASAPPASMPPELGVVVDVDVCGMGSWLGVVVDVDVCGMGSWLGVVVDPFLCRVVFGLGVVFGGGEVSAWAGTKTDLRIGFVHLPGKTSVVTTPPSVTIFRSCLRSGRLLESISPPHAGCFSMVDI